METKVNVALTLKSLASDAFVLNCRMPMGYCAGYPILQIRNGELLMKVPYLRYKVTGEVDKTLVYPIRYTITLTLPERNITGFEDLYYAEAFGHIGFSEPTGLFRHESIRALDKHAFAEKKQELYRLYDNVANALLYSGAPNPDDERALRDLLGALVEPSLKPMYRALDADFCAKFIDTEARA